MKGTAFFVALFAFCYLANGTSIPTPALVFSCDALSPKFGCTPSNWYNGDRLNCTDRKTAGLIMHWASKPVRSPCYKLFAGEETKQIKSYVPGELVPIHIKTTCFGFNFRGVLLYAVNGTNETKVGDWQIPEEDSPDFKTPWTNTTCLGSLMHATADLKPYLTTMYYQSPPKGTGTITFRTLLKLGDANTGAFYYVEKDLVLTEAAPVATDPTIVLGDEGASCDDTCAKYDSKFICHAASSTNTADFNAKIQKMVPCAVPLISGCGKDAATYNLNTLHCYYPGVDCAKTNRTAISTSCSSKINGVSRFCACISKTLAAATTGVQATGNNGGTTPAGSDSGSEDGDNVQGSSSTILKGTTSIIALAMFFVSPRTASVFLIFLGLTSAHNWVVSQSRSNTANLFKPYKPAITVLPHIQVGPGQTFQIEWVSAHCCSAYFAVYNAKYAEQYSSMISERMLDDYLALAPNSSLINAQTGKWQKFHRSDNYTLDSSYKTEFYYPNFFQRFVNESESIYIKREPTLRGPTRPYLLQFKPQDLATDKRAAYKSEKYPWLSAVHRFKHSAMQPSRQDVALFTVPTGSEPGRYIFHYVWTAYRDVIDVDYQTTQVANVYGEKSNNTRWKRIDHCNFVKAQRIYDISEVVTDVDYCLKKCASRGSGCGGVNLVPLAAPASAQKLTKPADTTWYYPNIYGLDMYADFNHTAFNNSETPKIIARAKPDRWMCYSVYPRETSTTSDEYVLSKDPDDPLFYSSCYYPYRGNNFPGYAMSSTPAIDKPGWKFASRCVDCQSEADGQLTLVPNWKIADVCVDCDKEVKVGRKPVPFPTGQVVEYGSRCDGYLGAWNQPTRQTCGATNKTCTIQLYPAGRTSSSDVNLEDCRALVAMNPKCSNTFSWLFNTTNARTCYCYSTDACCTTCSRRKDPNWATYEVVSTPDPTCSNGTKSEDGKSCCSKECGVGKCVPNPTGNNVVPNGFCNSDLIKDRPCSKFSAPCTI